MAGQGASHTDARYSTHNNVGRDQHNCIHLQPPPTSPKPPLSSFKFNDAPIDCLSAYFTGREQDLDDLKNIFDSIQDNTPTRCCIHGMPGIGKTQLALRYAKLMYDQSRYEVIFWISATTLEKLNHGFAKILNLVDHRDRDHPEQSTRLTSARRFLEELDSVKWLLIFDNVDQSTLDFLREHLPRNNAQGNILFTTRTKIVADAVVNAAGQQHQTLELRAPNAEDAAMLLMKEAGIPSSTVAASMRRAKALAKYVGCLPLAISLAASFVKRSRLKNLDDLLALYQSEHNYEIISWENDLSSYEQKSVAATFIKQLEQLRRQYPNNVSDLLKILSFLDPESIPLEMIVDGVEELQHQPSTDRASPESPHPIPPKQSLVHTFRRVVWRPQKLQPTAITAEKHVTNDTLATPPSKLLKSPVALVHSPVRLQVQFAIQQLQNLSLVGYTCDTKGTRVLRIHDLVQIVIQESIRREDRQSHWFHKAVVLIRRAFRQVGDPSSPECWAQCEAFSPHIQSLIKWSDKYAIGESEPELDGSIIRMADYLASRGRYGEAKTLYLRVLTMREEQLGPEHRTILHIVKGLAAVSLWQGQYSEAELLYKRVVAGREKLLGPEHRRTLKTIVDLAVVYRLQGRYKEAESLYKRALSGNVNRLEPEHQVTLRMKEGIAAVYQLQGRYREAESLYEQVSLGHEKLFGPDHRETLRTIGDLAVLHSFRGRYSEAESLYERSLAGNEKLLGPEHPDTLDTVENLAIVCHLRGRYSGAESLCDRALAGRVKLLGAEHPDTLRTTVNLALVYQLQGRYGEAEVLCQRAVAGNKEQLGSEHPNTLWMIETLATVYQRQGRYNEAESLFRQALTGHEKQLGPKHPNTLQTTGKLSLVYLLQEKYREAEEHCRWALAGHKKQLGREHPHTLQLVHILAIVLQSDHRYSKAKLRHQQTLASREKSLGPEHPDTLCTVHHLAVVYRLQGRHRVAEKHCRRALTGNEKLLGLEHPDTLQTVENLAMIYEAQERNGEAESLYNRALTGNEKVLGREHPDTLRTVQNLVEFFERHGRRGDQDTLLDRFEFIQS